MSSSPRTTPVRFDAVDALRGLAVLWMTFFHFCFDLNYFGFVRQDFYSDPVWTLQRTGILSLFLVCAGLGQALSSSSGHAPPRFWHRWRQIAGAAVLVSIGSYAVFPHSWIYFGVLHGIAAMLLLVRLTARWGAWLWLAGALAMALAWAAPSVHAFWPALDFLNAPAWNWLGLVSRKPITEDYVPILPWLGVLWWGVAAGQWLLGRHRAALEGLSGHAPRSLALLGRWSLTWYLLHQPVLMGLLAWLTKP